MFQAGKKVTKITVYRIKRVHPKIVTVTLADNTDAILPIQPDTYAWLVKLVNRNIRKRHWYPLIFTLDEKQYVIDIYPHNYERNEKGKLVQKEVEKRKQKRAQK